MAEKDRSDIDKGPRESEADATGEANRQDSAEARVRREARRRFLAGGIATAPLIVTLTSRPALATGGYYGGQGCGPSSLLSGNLSNNTEPLGCEGLTPGYWKTHPEEADKYIPILGPCNPITNHSINWDGWNTCDDFSVPTKTELEAYKKKLYDEKPKNWSKIEEVKTYLKWLDYFPSSPPFGTPFAQIFGPGLTQNPYTTMMQALWLDDTPPLPPDGVGGSSPVLAHSAAAYCNASRFGKPVYGLSPQEVVDLVNSMILVDPEGLKAILETMNSYSSS